MTKIKSVREQVYDQIIHMIKIGHLKEGDKVNIADLQETLGVSRPPINEALVELSANGILENINRKGFYVKGTTPKYKQDMMETVAVLDSYVIRNLIKNDEISGEVLDKLRVLVMQMEASIKHMNEEEYYEQQEAFHELYLSCCPNECIKTTITSLQRSSIRTTATYDTAEQQFSFFARANADHAKIVECIAARDAKRAADIVWSHWSGLSCDDTAAADVSE